MYVNALQMSKKELLNADFEGILKYFRVSLPKKYRNEETARQMIRMATSVKVKKLKKYEREYLALKGKKIIPNRFLCCFGQDVWLLLHIASIKVY